MEYKNFTILEKIRVTIRDRTTLPLARLFNGYVPYLPILIAIEPTSRCNLSCQICPRTHWNRKKIKTGDMTMDVFEQIVPYLTKRVTVSPQMFGEPLLASSFFEMVRIIKSHGCEVVINTNGTLLTPENCKLLVSEKVDAIGISMDGINALQKIRGVNIETIIEGLKNLNTAKAMLNKSNPHITIAFVGMRKNIEELTDVIEFARQYKVDGIQVMHLVMYSNNLLNESLLLDIKTSERCFELASKKAKEAGINLSLPSLEEKENLCLQPFNSVWVNWNGNVRPCCASTSHEKKSIVIGNIKNSSLTKLWNNEKMRKLRAGLLGLEKLDEQCVKCPTRKPTHENFNRTAELICL